MISSIVIGHEHARCNNLLVENLNEFGAAESSEIRYMIAGLNEMRHLILTKGMVNNFFKTIYSYQFIKSSYKPMVLSVYEDRFNFWKASVKRYEDGFFLNSHLPIFLKDIARLDAIKSVTKDQRPQSRKYWLECAEIDPSQIRAVAWTRSLLLSGFHFEWLGATAWEAESIEFLNNKFKTDRAFFNYLKAIAYACARTNMGIAWNALDCEAPVSYSDLLSVASITVDKSKQLLSAIHIEYIRTLKLLLKAIYEIESDEDELFGFDRLSLLDFWNDLSEEVRERENCLQEYYDIIVDRDNGSFWLQDDRITNNFYSAFINESNTAISYYMTTNKKSLSFLTESVN